MSEPRQPLDYEPSTRRGLWRDLFIGSIISWSILSTIGFGVVVMWVAVSTSFVERMLMVSLGVGSAGGVIGTIYRSTSDRDCRTAVLRGTLLGVAVGAIVIASLCLTLYSAV